MHTRRTLRAAILAVTVALLSSITYTASAAPLRAAQASSPFDSLDQYCTKSTAPPGTRNAARSIDRRSNHADRVSGTQDP